MTHQPPSSKVHFIPGLPRSGSSMLAAILRQNPAFHAAMSARSMECLSSVARHGSANEYSNFISNDQRTRIIRSLLDAYYEDLKGKKIIFDTNRRGWCAYLSSVAEWFPQAHVFCCVRSPAWILDSIERRIQASPFSRGKMFPAEAAENVYTLAEFMLTKASLRRRRVVTGAGNDAHRYSI